MIRRLVMGGFAATLLAVVGLGIGARTVSAEVIYNDVIPFSFTLDNPCQPGVDVINLSGFAHGVWYTTPDGSTIMRGTIHYTGTDSNGVQYVANVSRMMEHELWPIYAPFSDQVTMRAVSKGSGPNAKITVTLEYSTAFVPFGAAPYVTSFTCTG